MSKIIEAKAIISAADKTGGVFDKIAQKLKGVEKVAKSLSGVTPLAKMGWGSSFDKDLSRLKAGARELATIQRSWESFNSALARGGPMSAHKALGAIDMWKRGTLNSLREVRAGFDEVEHVHRRFFRGAGRFALTAAGVGGGAYAANRTIRAGVAAAATSQRESARDYLAGMPKAESDRIAAEAQRQSFIYRSVDASTMHAGLREAAMSMRSPDKALEISETLAQGMVVLQSLKGKDQAVEEARKFFSALDILGKNMDPKEVRSLFEGYVKALGVEGADMNLGGVLAMSKMLKSAGATVSDRFLMTTGVGLGRDMGDSKAGNAIAMMMQQEVQATKNAKAYGQKTGLRGKDGKFVDRSTMMRDPDYWAWKHIPEAMKKSGLNPNKPEDVTTYLQSAYSNQSSRDVLTKLMTQQEQYQAKAGQFANAPGLGAAGALAGKDPFVAMEGVFSQLRNFASQAPLMDKAAAGLDGLSGSIANMTKAFSSDQLTAGEKAGAAMAVGGAAAGTVGVAAIAAKGAYGWFTSGNAAMTGAAAALDGSAAALTAAAIKLGGGAKLSDVFPDPSKPGAPATKKPSIFSRMAGGLGTAAGAVGWASVPLGLAGVGAGAYYLAEGANESEGITRDSTRARQRKQQGKYNWWGKYTGGDPSTAGPEVSPTMTYGTGAGGDKSVSVSGEVHGQIEAKFVVEAGSTLLQVVEQTRRLSAELRGAINSNGPGSAGHSSPDAGAASSGQAGAP